VSASLAVINIVRTTTAFVISGDCASHWTEEKETQGGGEIMNDKSQAAMHSCAARASLAMGV